MKKIFLVLSVMILALSSVYAQDEAAADTTATDTTTTEQTTTTENQDTTETGDTVGEISSFAPTFTDLRNTDDASLDKEYNLLQTNLTKIKEDYLFRIVYKANKILENYTNINFTDTNEMFYNAVYYYDLVAKPIANDKNLDLALNEVEKCFRLYDEIKPIYEILGKTNELTQERDAVIEELSGVREQNEKYRDENERLEILNRKLEAKLAKSDEILRKIYKTISRK